MDGKLILAGDVKHLLSRMPVKEPADQVAERQLDCRQAKEPLNKSLAGATADLFSGSQCKGGRKVIYM